MLASSECRPSPHIAVRPLWSSSFCYGHLLGHSSYFSDRACPVPGWCPGLSSTLGNSSEHYFLILFFPLFPNTTCSSLFFFVLLEYINLLSALTVEGTAFSYSELCFLKLSDESHYLFSCLPKLGSVHTSVWCFLLWKLPTVFFPPSSEPQSVCWGWWSSTSFWWPGVFMHFPVPAQ